MVNTKLRIQSSDELKTKDAAQRLAKIAGLSEKIEASLRRRTAIGPEHTLIWVIVMKHDSTCIKIGLCRPISNKMVNANLEPVTQINYYILMGSVSFIQVGKTISRGERIVYESEQLTVKKGLEKIEAELLKTYHDH